MDIADIELVVVYGAPDTPSQFYQVHVYSSPITDTPLIGSFDQYFYNKLIFCYIRSFVGELVVMGAKHEPTCCTAQGKRNPWTPFWNSFALEGIQKIVYETSY